MGNSAVIQFVRRGKTAKSLPVPYGPQIYVHWNGGPESIAAAMDVFNSSGVTCRQTCAVPRFLQLFTNYFGGMDTVYTGDGPIRFGKKGVIEGVENSSDNGVYLLSVEKKDGKDPLNDHGPFRLVRWYPNENSSEFRTKLEFEKDALQATFIRNGMMECLRGQLPGYDETKYLTENGIRSESERYKVFRHFRSLVFYAANPHLKPDLPEHQRERLKPFEKLKIKIGEETFNWADFSRVL